MKTNTKLFLCIFIVLDTLSAIYTMCYHTFLRKEELTHYHIVYTAAEKIIALPAIFFFTAALITLLLSHKNIICIHNVSTQKCILSTAIVLILLYLVSIVASMVWSNEFALHCFRFVTQNAFLFMIPGILFALGIYKELDS